ncbi:MAG: serine/threonine-protein kinase [Myxococcota bacterium]
MSDLPELAEGTQLPDDRGRHFVLEKQVGRGGFSEVYLARLEQRDGLIRRVALKLLHPGLDPEGQPVERMRDEAKLLARLEHPVILTAHELLELGGRMAMLTEYVEGVDFKDCLDAGMPKGPILEVIEQVAEALHVAWTEHQVVHRDIKPANIRIGSHGNVKLLDFGIARYEGITRSAQTTSGTLLGTLTYLAPERFDLAGAPEPASDIFSLGCVLFEAWTGTRFFGGLEASKLLRLTEDADHFDTYLDERLLEHALDPIGPLLHGMLSFHADERPSAIEVARRCEQLAGAWPGRLTLRRWCRESRWPDPSGPAEDTPPPIVTSDGIALTSTLSQALDAPTVPVPPLEESGPASNKPVWMTLADLLTQLPQAALLGGSVLAIVGMLGLVSIIAIVSWSTSSVEEQVATLDEDEDPSLLPATGPFPERTVEPVAEEVEPLPPAPVRPPVRAKRTPVAPPEPVQAEVVAEPDADAPRHPILVTSVPSGANIELQGEFQNYTPYTLELLSGTYTLTLSLDDDRVQRRIKVGPFARGYVWCVRENAWKSTSSTDWREASKVCTTP